MNSMDAKALPDDVNLLKQMVAELFDSLKNKEQRIGKLQHYIEQLIRDRYGRKSERIENIDPKLLLPFIEEYIKEQTQSTEEQKCEAKTEPAKEEITYTRNKPKRKPLPADLPREKIEYDLDESQKVCDCCGEQLERIGSETSEQLDFVPATLKVIEHVRFKYACKHCEQKVVTATKGHQPIEKGIPAAGL
jgi:transposase